MGDTTLNVAGLGKGAVVLKCNRHIEPDGLHMVARGSYDATGGAKASGKRCTDMISRLSLGDLDKRDRARSQHDYHK
ncbi:hypothetical protein NDU88_003879 [Pleurodeles waltl]|uniref:Uncharacterized protein n=1 Tax=Pleurodeles waltl TaxID=8319 RepID=A0AAV7LGQ7_PLEWA|nr:hypothetical protein NDU88_003879 [Pleurodeles waltl]